MDESYIGPLCDHPKPIFLSSSSCHEGYMVLLHLGDEKFFKPIWLVRALLKPNFVTISTQFCQIQIESFCPCVKNADIHCHYIG